MKQILTFLLALGAFSCFGQSNKLVSTIDFVQVQNGNTEEAIFYYQNNWLILREMAVKEKYIHSYQFLEVPASEEAPFHLILITTYKNQKQYKKREDRFAKLIKEKGSLSLLNDKKPNDFRKVLFNKEGVKHLALTFPKAKK